MGEKKTVAKQIFDNIAREVEEYNKNNEINLSNLGLKDGKFYFTVKRLRKNHFRYAKIRYKIANQISD